MCLGRLVVSCMSCSWVLLGSVGTQLHVLLECSGCGQHFRIVGPVARLADTLLLKAAPGICFAVSGMTENRARQFWELRRHLRKNHVSITLSARIQKYAEHVLESPFTAVIRNHAMLRVTEDRRMLYVLQTNASSLWKSFKQQTF